MKKIFLTRRNALLSSTHISWGAFVLVLAVLAFLLRLLAPNLFWYIFAPVFHAGDTITETGHAFLNGFANTSELAWENETLRDANAAFALENEALREKLDSIEGLAGEGRGIIAGIVARPPTSPYDVLVLSAGSDAGVALGQRAFSLPAGKAEGGVPSTKSDLVLGVPLGTVSSVLSGFSRVTLFSAPSVSTDGWVGTDNLPLVIKGAGAGALSASAPRSANITEGDVVSVLGPGKLPIGVVVRVDSDPASPSVTLRIMPAYNL